MAEKDKFSEYERIRSILESSGYEVEPYKEIDYGLQFYIKYEDKKGLIRIYESKKGTRVDLSQVKYDKMLDDLEYDDYKEGYKNSSSYVQDDPDELIGTDESGKGDYFGPLVIAGVYADLERGTKLRNLGVMDSKKLSDKKIKDLALKIKEMCPYSIVAIGNEKYNELYEKFKNLNHMLAWGHARAIENVLGIIECRNALSDQFGDPKLIENALMKKGKNIILKQRPKAEENIAVAAASILARCEYIERISELSLKYEIDFPKGASSKVTEACDLFVQRYGKDELKNVAKLHFKITPFFDFKD